MRHIAILDFGSQYTHLIARRIRELGALANIYPTDVTAETVKKDAAGIILSGGPQSVYDKESPQIDAAIFNLGVPVLGLCYGHQLIARTLGGSVAPGTVREYGRAQLAVRNTESLLAEVNSPTTVWMSHGDTVTNLPEGFITIGSTADCEHAAVANNKRNIFGFQFHPEVRHTEAGMRMLNNFVFNACKAEKNWNIEGMMDDIIQEIQTQAKGRSVFLLVSGGVDSSVCFALLEKALGAEQVYGLYVDTGFMRKNESAEIKRNLESAGFGNLHVLDASDTFYQRLAGITDPEEKRKIIGQTFLDVKDNAAKSLGLDSEAWMLGQGTIYPDTIETGGTRHADTIKTHHNRVDAIQKLIAQGRVIEPLKEFYKDEVRHIGSLLGLPDAIIKRHPFPGPGLAIRILCSESGEQQIDAELPPTSSQQPLATPHHILPIRSVGVQGDNRTYAHPLAVWGETDWEKLDKFSIAVTNSTKEINRVVLLLNARNMEPIFKRSPKAALLTQERTALLQEIDHIALSKATDAGLYDDIWQFAVVLAPIGYRYFESVILRPVVSQEAMTAHFARIDHTILKKITDAILATDSIDYVFYDITNKPPGTIEWE